MCFVLNILILEHFILKFVSDETKYTGIKDAIHEKKFYFMHCCFSSKVIMFKGFFRFLLDKK